MWGLTALLLSEKSRKGPGVVELAWFSMLLSRLLGSLGASTGARMMGSMLRIDSPA
jgi:hypothetical protein